MKPLIIVFSTFFSIFAGIGFIRGLQIRTNPDVLHKLILAHIVPEQRQHLQFLNDVPAAASKAVELHYFCNDRTLMIWDVDSKQLNVVDPQIYYGIFAEIDSPHLLPFPISESQVLAFLGGSSGAWGIKDLAKYSEEGESSQSKQLVAAVLGGVTGYSVGYRAAMLGLPGCNSPRLLNSLRDSSKWEGSLEKDELRLALAAAAAQAKNIPDLNLRRVNMQKLFTEIQRIQSPSQKVSSASFFLAAEAGGPGYEDAMRKKASRQRLIDLSERVFSYICLGLFCSIAIYALWLKFHDRRGLAETNKGDKGPEPTSDIHLAQ